MARFGFCGPSYASRSLNADAQQCLNFYVEHNESGGGKSEWQMYGSPGLKVFSALAGMASVREELYFAGRHFVVAEKTSLPSSQVLFEVFADGTNIQRGNLGAIGAKPSLAANNANQLMIASGGRLFLLTLTTNVLTEIDTTTQAALQGPVAQIAFSDSYFIALLSNSQKFQISNLLDGSTWNPLNIAQVSLYPDNVIAMAVDHREIALMGPKQSVAYYDSGNANFPFEPVPSGFAEMGILAAQSLTKLDNSLFWIGADERGAGIAWRAVGYQPTRISNHAIEGAWQGYARMDDAIAYAFQDQGHTFWHVYFPTANKSWRYDVATSMWHEVAFNDGTAHRSQCHAFAFGKHLVGDWNSGNIYQMSIAFADDAGQTIRRVRRAPHISSEQERIFHSELQLDLETGLGPQPPMLDGAGKPRGPKVMLRWSDDGGHTWSNYYERDAGRAGEFRKRVIWRRLGVSRDRIYEVSVTDSVQWKFIDAYLAASPGFQKPTERLSRQYAKAT